MNITEQRRMALVNHLNVSIDEVKEIKEFDNNIFEYRTKEFRVLTDQEAIQATKEEIERELWLIKPYELASLTGQPQIMFEKVNRDVVGKTNKEIKQMINESCGMDKFVNNLIEKNGRSFYLANCDDKERRQDGFFIYKMYEEYI